jgi:NAD(P)H dehydrogenase (quinone)
MSDLPTIAVTGATGGLGGYVASNLAEAGVSQRLLVRRPDQAPHFPGAVVLQADYADETAARNALAGVTVLLMVSASESADRLDQHRTFIDSAVAAGVEHIVYTSFFGASPTSTFTLGRDHDGTEKYIAAAGIDHTFLRDSLYIDFMNALVGDDGVIRGPAGDGRVAAVAREDIARVASVVLQDPAAHRDVTYDLTGREALTLAEVAAILSVHRGTPVIFHNETLDEAYASRARYGAPDWQNDAWVSTYTAIAAGELAGISDDVERVTGRSPLTLAEFLARS